MVDNQDYCMVLTTVDNPIEAEKIATAVLDKGLGACVQLSDITSFYRWKGKLNKTPEILIKIKTKSSVYSLLEKLIDRIHPYDVPQVVKIPIIEGLSPYLHWIDESVPNL